MSVTDGSLTTDGAAQSVRVVGSITTSPGGTQTVSGTVTANQGTAAATANAWPTKLSNGTSTADLAPTAPSAQGNALLVTTGTINAAATLTAATTGNGTTVDFGAAKKCISLMIIPSAGVGAGAIDLQVSQNGTDWVKFGNSSATLAAGVNQQLTASSVAFRYARGVVSTTVTGGTVTCTLQGS